MSGYGNDQEATNPSGYSNAGYSGGYGSDEDKRSEVGYGTSGYGSNGYNSSGYGSEGYGGSNNNNAYAMPSIPPAFGQGVPTDGSGIAFDSNAADSGYTPPDVWNSGYQENVYDQATLLDTPYADTARDPNRGGNPAYGHSMPDGLPAQIKPLAPFVFEQSEPSPPVQPQQPQLTEAQKAKELEQSQRSQPKAYRSKVFDVELEL